VCALIVNIDPPRSVTHAPGDAPLRNPHRHRRLLRARRQRPRGRRAAHERNELAPIHSITSSAVTSRDGGTVRPSMRAVWLLMTSSNFADCSTGRSAGLAPLRTRPV
jgi:hypothetical protein